MTVHASITYKQRYKGKAAKSLHRCKPHPNPPEQRPAMLQVPKAKQTCSFPEHVIVMFRTRYTLVAETFLELTTLHSHTIESNIISVQAFILHCWHFVMLSNHSTHELPPIASLETFRNNFM